VGSPGQVATLAALLSRLELRSTKVEITYPDSLEQ
jgi:hypothetical protein